MFTEIVFLSIDTFVSPKVVSLIVGLSSKVVVRVFYIFTIIDPLKIVNLVVLFVAIFVINLWFVFWVWDPGSCHNSMDEFGVKP